MNRNETHALTNIIQAAVGYIEIGRLDAAIKTLMDAQMVMGMQALTWSGKYMTFALDKGYHLTLEGLPESALYVEVHHKTGEAEDESPRCFALPCSTAREVAEQMLAYCHAAEGKQTMLIRRQPIAFRNGTET